MTQEKVCFVIAPIGNEGTETRKRSDQVLKHIIKPAALECGYKAIRADEISEPGLITSQAIQHIVNAPLVIADLTERNPNVFYELAVRHATRKPLVQLIKKDEQVPFDVAGMRTISIDHHDLDRVEEAKIEIITQIRSIEKKKSDDMETPISASLEIQILKQSKNPEQRSLAELISSVSDIHKTLNLLAQKIANMEAQSVVYYDYPAEITGTSKLLSYQHNQSAAKRKLLEKFDNIKMQRKSHTASASKVEVVDDDM